MKFTSLALCSVLALVVAACDGSSSGGPQASAMPAAPNVLSPASGSTVNSRQLEVELPRIPEARSYEVFVEKQESVGPTTPFTSMVTDGDPAVFVNLQDGDYVVRYEAFDDAGEKVGFSGSTPFRILRLQEFFPTLEVTVDDRAQVQDGYRLMNFVGGLGGTRQLMAIANLDGEVVWNWEGPEFPGFIMAPTVKSDGSGVRAIRLFVGPDDLDSRVFEVDWDGNITNEFDVGPGITVHHELDELPDGRLYALGWEYETFNGIEAEGDTIEVFDPVTGAVEWNWRIFDHFTPLTRPVPEEADTGFSGRGTDWSHANGIDWDPVNSIFWVSVRHFDALIGVRYPSGDIVEIGPQGFGFESGLLFSHQHAPEVQPDGSILLWDNGNNEVPQVSSAKQITFDLVARTASIGFSWTDGLYDMAVGDSDRLPNGNTLVTHGLSRKLVEVNAAGEKVWEMTARSPLNEFFGFYRSDYVSASLLPESIR